MHSLPSTTLFYREGDGGTEMEEKTDLLLTDSFFLGHEAQLYFPASSAGSSGHMTKLSPVDCGTKC